MLDFHKTINSLFAANLQFEGSYDFVLKRKVLLKPGNNSRGVETFFAERKGDSQLYTVEYVGRREFNRAKTGDIIHCGVVRHIEKEDVFFVVMEMEEESAIRKIVRRTRMLFIAYLIAFLMVALALLTAAFAVLTIMG